jgi:hypothetical protein
MNTLLIKYPRYSLLGLMEQVMEESNTAKALITPKHYFKITESQYKEFMDNWTGGDLSACKAQDVYSWGGKETYYVYEISSGKVLAKIGSGYYLALNI